jgi:hypothetical protein
MPRLRISTCLSFLIVLTLLIAPLTASAYSLVFDPNVCTKETLGDFKYRACMDIVYVANPVDTTYQKMNIYIPEAYYAKGGSIYGYTAKTAPIFFPMTVGGYNPGPPATIETSNTVQQALLRGYVVAAPGARGRTTQDPIILLYTGKAPACIVDVKAAVRYLRYNDKIMPGDTKKIIPNGTSASGALSSLLGATGNNKDYEPYLKALGAANERDDVFAASCYAPIQNLDNADKAYEWQFNGIGTTLPGYDQGVSDDLKAMFPAYLNSLRLRDYEPRNCKGVGLKHAPGQIKKGTLLTLDANGEGTFKDYVVSFVIESAQKALDAGENLNYDWIIIENGTVTDIDFYGFSAEPSYPGRLPFKMPPPFDSLTLNSFETSLFGTATIAAQHFTQYGLDHNQAVPPLGTTLADKAIVKMLNPTYYIGAKKTTTAQYWRIRHGTIDHHTSLAIPVILATMLANKGYDVDFALPWEVDHSGDYDLDELFDWIDMISDHWRH